MSSRNYTNSDLLGLDIGSSENKPSLSNTTSNSHMSKMNMKTKVNPKHQNKFINNKADSKRQSKKLTKPTRKDNYGTVISKHNRKSVKITFIDEISEEPLVTVVDIQSIKALNVCSTLGATKGGKDVYVKDSACCSCVVV